jgi:hypothetical protein
MAAMAADKSLNTVPIGTSSSPMGETDPAYAACETASTAREARRARRFG